ncbi:MAG: undecaprenyl-diphosphate phosphatase [Verrucomicrobiaceae bacterium]|nr:undecaprenyl-diphosphate phosphatase [Verrucomicrobiaceae bacterium]
MNYSDAIILGIVQGLTEFLPVSSSGHLAITQEIIGIGADKTPIIFDLLLHVATLVAVLIYFRKRLILLTLAIFDRSQKEERRLIMLLCLATIPIVITGLCLKDPLEQVREHPAIVSLLLCFTGLILFLPGLIKAKPNQAPNVRSSILVGLAQSLALLPGISRSGSTIAAGLALGIRPALAAEFSFLLAIPAISGATLLKLDAISSIQKEEFAIYLTGIGAAFITGLLAIYAVISSIRHGKFAYFGVYCITLGIGGLIYFSAR